MNGFGAWLRAEWDRVGGTVLIVAGGCLLVATYQGVANSSFVADQAAYLASGGLGGLFLVAVGAMLRIQADLHDEWRKLDRIEAALQGERLADPATVKEAAAASRSASAPPASGAPEATGMPVPVAAVGLRLDWAGDRLRRALGVALIGLTLAAAVTVAGFQRTANTGGVEDAFEGLSLGVAGVALAALVAGAYTFLLRRRLAYRKAGLLGGWLTAGAAPATTAPAAASPSDMVVVVPGLVRYHRPGCPTLPAGGGSAVRRRDVGEHTPCAICAAG